MLRRQQEDSYSSCKGTGIALSAEIARLGQGNMVTWPTTVSRTVSSVTTTATQNGWPRSPQIPKPCSGSCRNAGIAYSLRVFARQDQLAAGGDPD